MQANYYAFHDEELQGALNKSRQSATPNNAAVDMLRVMRYVDFITPRDSVIAPPLALPFACALPLQTPCEYTWY